MLMLHVAFTALPYSSPTNIPSDGAIHGNKNTDGGLGTDFREYFAAEFETGNFPSEVGGRGGKGWRRRRRRRRRKVDDGKI